MRDREIVISREAHCHSRSDLELALTLQPPPARSLLTVSSFRQFQSIVADCHSAQHNKAYMPSETSYMLNGV